MNHYRTKVLDGMSGQRLFRQPIIMDFATEVRECPRCHQRLLVRKTSTRNLVKLDLGLFTARETEYHCSLCDDQPAFHSQKLQGLAASGARFCYDIMVYAGKAALQRYRTSQEIAAELYQHNVQISSSEVRVQIERFVLYLAEAHQASQGAIKSLLQKQGGYILHLDSTCDGASSHLMSALDGISELVLLNAKIPSENADDLIPILQEIKNKFGKPLAVVSDMAKSIHKAVTKVFGEKVSHYICQFHFLRDIGKDLLKTNYSKIRQCLKKHGIASLLHRRNRELKALMGSKVDSVEELVKNVAQGILPKACKTELSNSMAHVMIEWALAGKKQGNGYGFPFDLSLVEFYKRLKNLEQALKVFVDAATQPQTPRTSLAVKLLKDLDAVMHDKTLQAEIMAIHEQKEVFDQLRQAMRLALPDKNIGLNDDGEDVDMKAIESSITVFLNVLRQRKDFTAKGDYGKMAAQIEKYKKQLFTDPIRVQTAEETKLIYPNRTNNILERFFRYFKRAYRRQTGNGTMRRKIDTMLADTTLVKNLENATYLEILLDGCSSLEERFAQIDYRKIRQEINEAKREEGRTLPGLRKILGVPDWPQKVAHLWENVKSD